MALPVTVTMHQIGERIGEAYERLDLYLASRGIHPSGPAVVRYRTVTASQPFVIDVGWVIPENTWIDLPYVADVLPGGRYAVGAFAGPYATLAEVTTETMMWADLAGFDVDVSRRDHVEHWESRIEVYLDDPRVGPDGLEGPVEVCLLTRG